MELGKTTVAAVFFIDHARVEELYTIKICSEAAQIDIPMDSNLRSRKTQI